ncbi:uncharacterized protein [Amphiura filiformis]|uniref:uncharacterized protein n=1 Tax=Amphiura filiformis TaxID=82378 RepID=UPI003B22466E
MKYTVVDENGLMGVKLRTLLLKYNQEYADSEFARCQEGILEQIKLLKSIVTQGLQEKSSDIGGEKIPNPLQDRWVVNKSDHVLSQDESSLLCRGLNFSVAPDHVPVVDLITSVENAVRKLDKPEANQSRCLDFTVSQKYTRLRVLSDPLFPPLDQFHTKLLATSRTLFLRWLVLKNSADFVDKISNLTLGPGVVMVSYDVTALFTKTPIPDTLRIIRELLNNDSTLSYRTSVDNIMELLTFCVNTTYFMFQGDIFRQENGAAMGSPVSPLVANLFMEWFEQQALSTYPAPPSFWARYVDDTFVVIQEQQVDAFTTHINNISPSIKCTIEREENGQIAMLDTMISRKEDGTLKVTIYRKPTHTDQYLSMDSHHPLQHKLGVIRTLEHRANTLVSDAEDKIAELEHIRQSYSKWTACLANVRLVTRFATNLVDNPTGRDGIDFVLWVN